jgi:hypothetical protein
VLRERIGLALSAATPLGVVTHAFTHRALRLHVFRAEAPAGRVLDGGPEGVAAVALQGRQPHGVALSQRVPGVLGVRPERLAQHGLGAALAQDFAGQVGAGAEEVSGGRAAGLARVGRGAPSVPWPGAEGAAEHGARDEDGRRHGQETRRPERERRQPAERAGRGVELDGRCRGHRHERREEEPPGAPDGTGAVDEHQLGHGRHRRHDARVGAKRLDGPSGTHGGRRHRHQHGGGGRGREAVALVGRGAGGLPEEERRGREQEDSRPLQPELAAEHELHAERGRRGFGQRRRHDEDRPQPQEENQQVHPE